MHLLRCNLWIHFIIGVASFYPYKPGTSPTRTVTGGINSISHVDSIQAAGGAENEVPYAIMLNIKRAAVSRRANQKRFGTLTRSPVKRDNNYDFLTASPPTQTNSEAIHEDGTDFSYFASINFGSSGKPMYMLIDTGAANTWVMGSDCKSQVCGQHSTLGPSDSPSLEVFSNDFDLTYGTGSVSGSTARDNVKIAGMSISLPFGLASEVSEDFSAYPMDGILGLGPPSSRSMEFPTAMETIQKAKALSSNLFGVNLQRADDGSIDGEISFGAPNQAKYQGPISHTSLVAGASMWEIPIDDAKVNGKSCSMTGKSAIIDTGTSFILLPPSDAEQLHSQIPGSQQDGETFNIPCTCQTPVQLIFSGVSYSISPADYVGDPISDGSSTCTTNFIGRRPFGPDQWLVGDVFLKNVYSVFDYDEKRIGFASKTSESTPTSAYDPQATPSHRFAVSSSRESTTSTSTSVVEKPTTVATTASPSTSGSPQNASAASAAEHLRMQLCTAILALLCFVFSVYRND
ncbi:MAG: hypothetical protein Q9184_000488 [Pyrenodesmia sp. 2 TL-2023]